MSPIGSVPGRVFDILSIEAARRLNQSRVNSAFPGTNHMGGASCRQLLLFVLVKFTFSIQACRRDEAGRLVHHQGDFRLDDLTVRGMLALRTNGQPGLHGFTLPSGANVYFLRQGGLTLMVSFPGPASPQELSASVQQLRSDRRLTFDLLDGLEPPVAALAAIVLTSPVKRDVLAFFRQRRQTAIEAGDLAYWVNASEDDVTRALGELADLDLVQHQCICDTTFYRLNHDPQVTTHLDRLFVWRHEWQTTLDRLEQTIGRDPIATT